MHCEYKQEALEDKGSIPNGSRQIAEDFMLIMLHHLCILQCYLTLQI